MNGRSVARVLTMLAVPALALAAACSGGDPAVVLTSRNDLKSYRAELVQERLNAGGEVEARLVVTGEAILPDRERQTMAGSVGGAESRAESIAVGDRVWVRGDGGHWRTGERADSQLSLAQPSYEQVDAVTSGLEGAGETVSGIDVLRYELNSGQVAELFGFMLPALEERTVATIWSVPGAGLLVRYVIEGPDARIRYEMTDVNATDIAIEPPDVVAIGPVETGGSGVGGVGPLFEIVATETSREDTVGSFEQPPALTASAGAESVSVGLGTYCWTPPDGPGLCADSIGIITGRAALPVGAGRAVTVSGDLSEAGASGVTGWAIARPVEPLADGADWLAWNPFGEDPVTLEITLSGGALTFYADPPPGRYIVALFLDFPQGDASYGLLLDVE